MSTEIVLLSTIIILLIALFGFIFMHVWYVRIQDAKEKSYINALLSKNVHEFTKAEVDQKTVIEEKEEKEPDFYPEQELTDEEWFQKLEKNQ